MTGIHLVADLHSLQLEGEGGVGCLAARDVLGHLRGDGHGLGRERVGDGEAFLGIALDRAVVIVELDLAPDVTKEDEYVALVSAQGVETKCEITFSDLQNVKAQLAAALEPGDYTLRVYTRSGLGERFGVHVAKRKVTVA